MRHRARAELRTRLLMLTAALTPSTPRGELLTLVWRAQSAAVKAESDGDPVYGALSSLYRDLQEGRPIYHVEMVSWLTSYADRL